jgi:hypothetical protein
VAVVGSAAPAEDGEGGQCGAEVGLGRGEGADVTFIELLGLVEFSVALERGVGADANDPVDPGSGLAPCSRLAQSVADVRGVSAIDQVVVRSCDVVDGGDGVRDGGPAGQPAVGFDREGDGDGQSGGAGGLDDADGLRDVSQGEGGGEIGRASCRERVSNCV